MRPASWSKNCEQSTRALRSLRRKVGSRSGLKKLSHARKETFLGVSYRLICRRRRFSAVSGKNCRKSLVVRHEPTAKLHGRLANLAQCAPLLVPARRTRCRSSFRVTESCARMAISQATAGDYRGKSNYWHGNTRKNKSSGHKKAQRVCAFFLFDRENAI